MLLVFVALVPWLRALRTRDARYGWRSGLGFGAIFWLTQMAWVVPFVGRWTGSYWLALIPYLMTPVLGMWFFGLVGWAMQRAFALQRAWAIPLIWASVEFLRAYMPELAFPWGFLATPLWTMPVLIQTAGLGTVFLTSAWVALINVLLTEVIEGGPRPLILRTLLVAIIGGVGSVARWSTPPPSESVVIGIGQLGEDMAFGDPSTEFARLSVAVPDLRRRALGQGARFLVMPEGLADGADARVLGPPDLARTPMLFGGQREVDGLRYQSAFVVQDGAVISSVDKTRLVVFGERVPFRSAFTAFSAFNLPSGDLAAGTRIAPLDLDGIPVGPVICFEALFPDVARSQADAGARLLAVMSIDDWYMGTNAPEQLLAASAFRSVETGLPLVRSASLGISGWFDARGNLRASAPLGVRTVIRAEVPVPRRGDGWPYQGMVPWAMAAVSGWSVFVRPRSRKSPVPAT